MRQAGARVMAIAMVALLAACQQAVAPNRASTQRSAGSAIAPSVKATTSPIATPAPTLLVERVGASASPSGFLAFAVVRNPSALRAVDVAIDITDVDSSGATLAKRTGHIGHIEPGQREAVSMSFPVGRSLPATFKGAIANVTWDTDTSPDPLEVAAAIFVQDARTPSVRVHLIDHSSGAIRAGVVAVCWDGAGNIRGGGSRTLMVNPGDQGRDFTFSIAISTVPSRCDAFGLTQALG